MKHQKLHDHDIQATYRDSAKEATSPELHPRQAPTLRPWLLSTGGALLMVGLLVAISVLVNPLLGRYIHWRRIDLGAPVVFLGLALALRRRWV